MSILARYPSTAYDSPTAIGPVIKIPFGPNNNAYYITQDFAQFGSRWKQASLNTTYIVEGTTRPGYFLVEESPIQDMGGGLVRWTRTYAPIFPDYSEWEQYAMVYPGLSGNEGLYTRDALIMQNAASRLDSKWFLLGVSLQDRTPYGAINTYADIQMLWPIPILDSVMGYQTTYSGADAVAIASPELYPDAQSDSTLTEALYVANVTNNVWMVAEPSVLRQWKGNLYQRITRYVQAR